MTSRCAQKAQLTTTKQTTRTHASWQVRSPHSALRVRTSYCSSLPLMSLPAAGHDWHEPDILGGVPVSLPVRRHLQQQLRHPLPAELAALSGRPSATADSTTSSQNMGWKTAGPIRLTFRLGTASQAMSAREGISDVSRDSPLTAGREAATSGDHKAGNRLENDVLGWCCHAASLPMFNQPCRATLCMPAMTLIQ